MKEVAVFWRFFTRRFPIPKYVVYVVLWVAAMLSALAPLRTSHDSVGPSVTIQVCGALALFVVLFFMRAVDEVKDLDYDRRFNPDRPLVTGEVTKSDVRVYLLVSAVITLVLSAVVGLPAVVVVIAIMVYALFLFWLENNSRRFSESMYGNITVTVQLKTILLIYTVALSWAGSGPTPALPTALLVLAFMFAYLHWEIARKTFRRQFARPGEKLYSTAIGAAGAATVAGALLTMACVLRIAVAVGWEQSTRPDVLLLLLPIPFAAWGAIRLAKVTDRRYAPDAPSLLAYVIFLLSGNVRWLLFHDVVWFG